MSNVIVAIVKDAQPWQFGFRYFDEDEWPVEGYELIQIVTGTTKAKMNALERERIVRGQVPWR